MHHIQEHLTQLIVFFCHENHKGVVLNRYCLLYVCAWNWRGLFWIFWCHYIYKCIYIAVKVYEVSVKYIYMYVCMYENKVNVQNAAYKRMLEIPFSTRVLVDSNVVFFSILFLPDIHRDNINIPLLCLKFLEAIMRHWNEFRHIFYIL